MGKKPNPEIGLIINYDYLWLDQQLAGQEDGNKDRPCAVIAASRIDENGDYIVLLCAISHTDPENDNDAIKLPIKVANYCGLDDRQQWIRTNEYNEVKWSDPGIIPAHTDQWEYGRMPEALYQTVKLSLLEHSRQKSITKVKRK